MVLARYAATAAPTHPSGLRSASVRSQLLLLSGSGAMHAGVQPDLAPAPVSTACCAHAALLSCTLTRCCLVSCSPCGRALGWLPPQRFEPHRGRHQWQHHDELRQRPQRLRRLGKLHVSGRTLDGDHAPGGSMGLLQWGAMALSSPTVLLCQADPLPCRQPSA